MWTSMGLFLRACHGESGMEKQRCIALCMRLENTSIGHTKTPLYAVELQK